MNARRRSRWCQIRNYRVVKLILEALENVTSVEKRENPRCRDLEKSCEYKSLLNSLFFTD